MRIQSDSLLRFSPVSGPGYSSPSSGEESRLSIPDSRPSPWAQPDSSLFASQAEATELPQQQSTSTQAIQARGGRLKAEAAGKHAEERLAAALRVVGAEQTPNRRALQELAQAAAGAAKVAHPRTPVGQQSLAERESEAAELLLTAACRAQQQALRARQHVNANGTYTDQESRELDSSPPANHRKTPISVPHSTSCSDCELVDTAEHCEQSGDPHRLDEQHSGSESVKSQESESTGVLSGSQLLRGFSQLRKGSVARTNHYGRVGKASRTSYRSKGRQHSRLSFSVTEKPSRQYVSTSSPRRSQHRTAEERILVYLLWLLDAMSKSPTKSTRRTKKVTSDTLSTKARQWESVRRELEAKVISLQDELSGMRKWCLAALGEAEKRTGELRSQNAAVQRQLVEETQRKVEALQSAEDNMRKLQEEKKLKLMVYGQTLTKHKEMAEESEEVQQQLEDEIVAREDAERRLTDAEAETEHLQSQLAHLEREFQLQLTQHHETTAANTEEYEAQIQKLKEQLSTAEATQVKLEQDAQAADASRRSMETRIADMEGASNIKDHQLTDLRATVERLSAQVDDKAESLRKLETEKHDMSLALSRETEAQRYLKERVDELTRDTQAHAARTKEFGDKHEDVHSQLTAATAALRDEQAKREKAEAELIRLSAHSDLPAKVLSIEKAMNELQIKLGATEAALEIANVNVATWKGDHARLKEDSRKVQEDLETQLEGMTKKNETKIAELTEALDAEQTKSIRLESETSRLNEESTRLLETKEKQAGQIETLTIQVQDLRRVSVDKETQITKFNETAQKLSEHIAELETDKTKSGHLIETTAAEKLRLSEELKVATQQLDMMREVTRQLYAKITEQVRCRFYHLTLWLALRILSIQICPCRVVMRLTACMAT